MCGRRRVAQGYGFTNRPEPGVTPCVSPNAIDEERAPLLLRWPLPPFTTLLPLWPGLLLDQRWQRFAPLPPPPYQVTVLRPVPDAGRPPRRPPVAEGMGWPLGPDVVARPVVLRHRLDRFHRPVVTSPVPRLPPPVPVVLPLRLFTVAPLPPRVVGLFLLRLPLLAVQPRVEGGVTVRPLGVLSPPLLLLLPLLLPHVAALLPQAEEQKEKQVVPLVPLPGPTREL